MGSGLLGSFGKAVQIFGIIQKRKVSKAIADTLLHHMKDVNSMVFLTSSKLSALTALRSVLTVYLDDSLEAKSTVREISDQLVFSCIDHICQNFVDTVESLAPELGDSEDIFHLQLQQNCFSVL
ncbi:hypothetical protein M0R45_007337 [Rubus argutus]|uniref:Uncharacterized protein n=1 Tax=Rubus argutus TaxID=59490 RepID=A0AAW1XZX2_RUBAR